MNAGRSHQSMVLATLTFGRRSTAQLADALAITRRQAADAAAGLIAKGLATRLKPGEYAITEEGRAFHASGKPIASGPNAGRKKHAKPRASTLRQRAWNAMRVQGKFTLDDLIMVATHGSEEDPRNNLSAYCSALEKAGILNKLRSKVPGTRPNSNGFVRYQLARNLGDLAPMVSSKSKLKPRHVFDQNSGQEFPF